MKLQFSRPLGFRDLMGLRKAWRFKFDYVDEGENPFSEIQSLVFDSII